VLRFGPQPEGRAIHLLEQACRSLAEAHGRGLIHRDIKADNLFTCRMAAEVDVVKVLDFGIVARVAGPGDGSRVHLSRLGTVQGTPTTMSPEQSMGLVLDPRSDLYSLGCVAYWLLTGTDPFRYHDPYDILHAHVREAPVSPSRRLGRPILPDLEALVIDLLAKDPTCRPQSAQELARRLAGLRVPEDAAWNEARAVAWWRTHLERTAGTTSTGLHPAAGQGPGRLVGSLR
jgi:serine/threonine-protein kinase